MHNKKRKCDGLWYFRISLCTAWLPWQCCFVSHETLAESSSQHMAKGPGPKIILCYLWLSNGTSSITISYKYEMKKNKQKQNPECPSRWIHWLNWALCSHHLSHGGNRCFDLQRLKSSLGEMKINIFVGLLEGGCDEIIRNNRTKKQEIIEQIPYSIKMLSTYLKSPNLYCNTAVSWFSQLSLSIFVVIILPMEGVHVVSHWQRYHWLYRTER